MASWVKANHRRRQKVQRGANPACMGGNISASKRRALAPANSPVIAMKRQESCIKRAVFASTGQAIDAAGIGQISLVDLDARNLHGQTTIFPVWVLAMKARCAS